jgi:LuxR family maltose regulon positive regulatory protein
MSFAKTTRPVLRSVVMRDRLFALLDEAADRAIAWISAPPGYGKTTLVSSYLEARKLPHIWYQVDAGDADIASFVHFLGVAARKVGSGRASPVPRLSAKYAGDLSAFARYYFRELFDAIKPPLAIVFDNFHEAPLQSPLHRFLQIGLQEMPRSVRALFISRAAPPPEVAPFAATGTLVFIGPDLLRLSADEVGRVGEMRGLQVSRDLVRQMQERSGGWAAGVVLMLEDCRRRGTLADISSRLTSRIVFDYLAGEVFDKFDEPVRRFLLRIACTPQITASMAGRLTESDDARRILINLALNNYFITENQGERESEFQLHPLFREFLLERAQELLPAEERSALKRGAAAMLLEDDQVETAMDLLFDLKDFTEAARVIRERAPTLLDEGRSGTILHWLEQFPPAFPDQDPWLLYWTAACQLQGSPRESRRYFEEAFAAFARGPGDDARGRILSALGVIDSTLHEFDDLGRLAEWNARLIAALDENRHRLTDPESRHLVLSVYTSLVLSQPGHADVPLWTSRALAVVRDRSALVDSSAVGILTLGLLALGATRPTAAEILEIQRSAGDAADLAPMDQISLYTARAYCLALTGEHETCLETATRALQAARVRGICSRVNQLLACCAGACLGLGKVDDAARLLDEMQAGLPGGRRVERCIYDCLIAWLSLLRGQPIAAHDHLSSAVRQARELGVPQLEAVCRAGLALALHECGDAARSDVQRRRAVGIAEETRNPLLSFMVGITNAVILRRQQRTGECTAALHGALQIGRQHNFSYACWWLPAPMAGLLEFALRHDIEPVYARHVIRRRRLAPETPPLDLESWPWEVRICTFGELTIVRDDTQLAPSKKSEQRPLQLLMMLIAMGVSNVDSHELARALWPRVDEEYAYKSFTIALHRLRRFLGNDDVVLLRDGRLGLNPRICWVDVLALERVVMEIEQLAATEVQDPEHVLGLGRRLQALYRGPFLERVDQHGAIAAARQRLREFADRAAAILQSRGATVDSREEAD